jgi:hypothetical protein
MQIVYIILNFKSFIIVLRDDIKIWIVRIMYFLIYSISFIYQNHIHYYIIILWRLAVLLQYLIIWINLGGKILMGKRA